MASKRSPRVPSAKASPRKRIPAAERRAQVLDAALRLFARGGFEGTTFKDLAGAAGVSEAMLVKLFGTKRQLYTELIERQIERTGGPDLIAAREPPEGVDDVAFFESFALRVLELGRAETDFMRLLAFGVLEGDEFARMFYEVRMRAIIDALASYIRGGIEAGRFREVDPRLAALGFLGMLSEFPLGEAFRLAGARRPSASRLARSHADIFVRGLQAEPPIM